MLARELLRSGSTPAALSEDDLQVDVVITIDALTFL